MKTGKEENTIPRRVLLPSQAQCHGIILPVYGAVEAANKDFCPNRIFVIHKPRTAPDAVMVIYHIERRSSVDREIFLVGAIQQTYQFAIIWISRKIIYEERCGGI